MSGTPEGGATVSFFVEARKWHRDGEFWVLIPHRFYEGEYSTFPSLYEKEAEDLRTAIWYGPVDTISEMKLLAELAAFELSIKHEGFSMEPCAYCCYLFGCSCVPW